MSLRKPAPNSEQRTKRREVIMQLGMIGLGRMGGMRSCAIRYRTSEKGEHLVKLMERTSAPIGARWQTQQKEASRHTAPDARERIPCRRLSGSVLSLLCAYQRFNSNQKQRPSCQSSFRTLLGQECLTPSHWGLGSNGKF